MNAKPIGEVTEHLAVPHGVVALLKATRWMLQKLTFFEFEEKLRNCYEMIPKGFQSREIEKRHLNTQGKKLKWCDS